MRKKKDNKHIHSHKAARRSLEKHTRGEKKHYEIKQGNTLGEFDIKVLGMFHRNPHGVYNVRQLTARMELPQTMQEKVSASINHLLAVKQIEECEKGRYKAAPTTQYIVGTMDFTASGAAYLIPDDKERYTDDIYIPSNSTAQSLHGDKVRVYVFKRKSGRRPEGEVVEIISRAKTHFVGRIEISGNYGFVLPDNNRIHVNFYIPREGFKDAKNGDKVIVEIASWPEKAAGPVGRITEVLGTPGQHDVEIHSILAEYGLPYRFEDEVEKEAAALPLEITSMEISHRRDMRGVTTFTIDPADAKDFDDAISFEELENGNYSIGVHIADVSHYMQEGTLLDEEAYERGTSVYLVDRVVPMLPEVLCNNVCSLRPDEDKLTFSAVFEMNSKGEILNEWFGRTVTHSVHRFTYEEAQAVIEGGDDTLKKEILTLDSLAKKMRAVRMKNGAISFDKEEVKFSLDDKNEPIGIHIKVSKDAHKLIEEFMLLANRRVATYIGREIAKDGGRYQGNPPTFVYRVHDDPNPDKLFALSGIARQFGYKISTKDRRAISSSLNKLLKESHSRKEGNMMETLAMRCMAKAEYSTDNIGHYGLAFDYYTHFTSPIRRYPDVMAHRLLARYLDGGKSVDAESYEEKCKHSSERERIAAEAERDSVKYMQVKYITRFAGQDLRGVISGVTEWGIYVETIDSKCEGMVRIRDLRDDYYSFDSKNYALVGENSHNVLRLGDEVIVRLKNADLERKQIDFEFVSTADALHNNETEND